MQWEAAPEPRPAVPVTYNQHDGVAHTAVMPEGLAAFFISAPCPPGGIAINQAGALCCVH